MKITGLTLFDAFHSLELTKHMKLGRHENRPHASKEGILEYSVE
jgi:hypothetical protein